MCFVIIIERLFGFLLFCDSAVDLIHLVVNLEVFTINLHIVTYIYPCVCSIKHMLNLNYVAPYYWFSDRSFMDSQTSLV